MKTNEWLGFTSRFRNAEVTEIKGYSIEEQTDTYGNKQRIRLEFTARVEDEK